MAAITHETCVEYFKRRLREGWKCIGIEGDIASLLSPDGSFHKLDLKNDSITLRPSGVGTYSQNVPKGTTPGWACCDEVVADDFSTYVQSPNVEAYRVDTYALPDQSLSGTISSVTIYCRVWASQYGAQQARAGGYYRTNSTNYSYGIIYGGTQWYNRNTGALANNPQSGSPWTWAEIDALEIGNILFSVADPKEGWFPGYCTQTYAVVVYTPAPPGAPRSQAFIIG